VEQLIYTWAENGVEGRSQFQVRAVSPGFADQASKISRAARRLCQYSWPPISKNYEFVSFGWIDFGATRFIFRRCDAGLDGFGRPGKFFAHIVAGEIKDLQSSNMAQTYDSVFWLRDDAVLGSSLTLDQVDPSSFDVINRIEPSTESKARFLAGLKDAQLHNQCLAILTSDSAEVASLFAWIARSIPRALDRMAVSTYESRTMAGNFQVVGVASEDDAPDGSLVLDFRDSSKMTPSSQSVMRFLAALERGASEELTAAFIASQAEDLQEIRYDVLLNTYEALESLNNRDTTEIASILPVMETSDGARQVLGYPEGIKVVANEMIEGNEDVWRVIENQVQSLSGSSEISDLGLAVGHRMWQLLDEHQSSTHISVINRVRSISAGVAGVVVGIFLEDAKSDPNAISTLDIVDRMTLARQLPLVPELSREGTNNPVVRALIDVPVFDVIKMCSVLTNLDLRTWLLGNALAEHPDDAKLIEVSARNSDVLSSLISTNTFGDAGERIVGPLILNAPDSALYAVRGAAMNHRTNADVRDHIACALTERLGDSESLRFLSAYLVDTGKRNGKYRKQLADRLSDLVASYVIDHRLTTEPLMPYEVTQAFRIVGDHSSRARAWSVLFEALSSTPRRIGIDHIDDVFDGFTKKIKEVGLLNGNLAAEMAAELVADKLLEICRSWESVEKLRQWLNAFVDSSKPNYLGRLLRSASRRESSFFPAESALRWVDQQVKVGGIDSKKFRASELYGLAKRLATGKPALDEILKEIEERSQKIMSGKLHSLFTKKTK